MPAHIFELLYAYYYLKNRDGRPPSAYKVAAFLKIDFCTVLQRRKRAVACKVIVEPETYPVIGDWAVFTDRGAEAFVAIMEGNEVAPCEDGTLPMPPPAVIRPPLIEKTWDLVEVPIHASLEKGMRLMQKGDWAAASKALSIAVAGLSEKDFEAKIIGNALLGRACDRNGDEPCAKSAYTKVLDVAKNSKAKIEAAIALHGDAATTMVARLMYAQGEALFYKAEQKRKAAEAIAFPLYRGSGDKDDVFQHIDTKVIDWIKKKRPVVEETEQAYGEILALKPAPPPAWIVLAAGRKGDMWSAFVYELQTLPPMPSEWSGTGTVPGTELTYEELRTEFRTKLGAASAPVRQHAAEAYESCRDQAKEHGVAAAEGKRCAERLTAMGVTP